MGKRTTTAALRQSCWLLPIAIASACASSVASINDQAMLVGPDPTGASAPPDPTAMMRRPRTEYRIGARDLLEIEVYELEEPNKSKQLKMRVSQDGTVVVPLLGQVLAAGCTVQELQTEITKRLGADFLVNPSVSVMVAEHESRRVTVLGAVQSPGTFRLRDNSTTLVDALALAGGPSDKAGSAIYVLHEDAVDDAAQQAAALGARRALAQLASHSTSGEPPVVDASEPRGDATALSAPAAELPRRPKILKIDLIDLVERGDLSVNCVLEDGDVVHVPPAAQFFVMGEVNQGGAFPLRGEITLLRAIAMAGGLKNVATPSATVLIRTTPQGRVTIPIDLNEVEAGSVKDLPMQADDVLVVNESGGDGLLRGIGSFIKGLFHIGYNI